MFTGARRARTWDSQVCMHIYTVYTGVYVRCFMRPRVGSSTQISLFKISDSRSIIVLRASSFSFPQSSFQRKLFRGGAGGEGGGGDGDSPRFLLIKRQKWLLPADGGTLRKWSECSLGTECVQWVPKVSQVPWPRLRDQLLRLSLIMPERKHSFSREVFPYVCSNWTRLAQSVL